ncbi:MAG: UbiX family flavin prenyltransferase [Spirochaetes bacterium]|nr:UbiX family flavin prenyltransferase [Spirochaetota bacterium]MBU1079236.1 UbiX family flavin prenyltransferase [Spirochaetota bacterium]
MGRYLVCVTGASGSAYGRRTLEALIDAGHEVHAVFSAWGERVFETETGLAADAWLSGLGLTPERRYASGDMAAPPSSGSWRLDGTVIVPCSMSTVGAVASGATTNLIHRAAAVALKEGRRLVVVPRETPWSLVDLRNMTSLAEAGAAILPACPGFYHAPTSIEELVDFVAGKILDRLGVEHELYARWAGGS